LGNVILVKPRKYFRQQLLVELLCYRRLIVVLEEEDTAKINERQVSNLSHGQCNDESMNGF
jgi:hypothetical protein